MFKVNIAKGGNLLQVIGTAPPAAAPPPKRGEITGFSAAARRRMIKELQSIDREAAAPVRLFITLTYPSEWPEDSREWKRHLDNFRKRFMREFDVQCAWWKLEPQKRGAPHFHLLVFLDREVPIQWLSMAWYECVGSNDIKHLYAGTQVQRIMLWEGISSYTSKYVAKTINGHDLPDYWHGIKWWGRWGTPPITMQETTLTRPEFIQLRRLMCRLTKSKGIGHYLKRRSSQAGRYLCGLTLFASDTTAATLITAAAAISHALTDPSARRLIPQSHLTHRDRHQSKATPTPSLPIRSSLS